MDALQFDGYASYSDSSAPRTPSPNQPTLVNMNFPLKQNILDEPSRILFQDSPHDDNAVIVHPENAYGWAGPPPVTNFHYSQNNSSRGSLLHDLYSDHDIQEQHQQHHHTPEFPNSEPQFIADNWNQQQQHNSRPNDFQMMRRATFPYVRHDRDETLPPLPQQGGQFFPQQQQHQLHSFSARQQEPLYPDSITLSQPGDHYPSPHTNYQEFDDNTSIKLEDSGSMMMPSQNFYRPPQSSSANMCHPMTMSYLSPHTGLPVQHTDDAASKETQYLRRRCFNCHTTEPPSWRRSTLNPGKIVCNKCGLYERTHLRPRPLRFDELRAGNKARKQNKRTLSPKSRVATAAAAGNGGAPGSPNLVKKEPREFGLVRRSSVSSISSAQSGSGASDWDDNVSLYSSGSAPPTSYNSPSISPYPLSRDDSSSPNGGGVSGIRLPNAPLSDIASINPVSGQTESPQLHSSPLADVPNAPSHPSTLTTNSPRRSQTSPDAFFAQGPSPAGQEEYFMMRRRTESVGSAHSQHEGSLLSSPAPTPVMS
ncbi:hypothetical protein DFP72DRAFT_592703 [Ephemerocybe angulata]|uniref:GATA-type domain-containing protein n=1 Tax=Ephemerocybe angulata TaxID=980116 RepID=A0A8H6IAI8_9AGAR|nr:hypothetical protein DFP72DRAFT_592703 [Tulosesus angulatus]